MHWPDDFEQVLKARGQILSRPRTRAQKQASRLPDVPTSPPISFQFKAEGKDNATYVLYNPSCYAQSWTDVSPAPSMLQDGSTPFLPSRVSLAGSVLP